jgi:hypothetical protein
LVRGLKRFDKMTEELPMSEYPDYSPMEGEWSESENVCGQCKTVKMWTCGWYDDPIEQGGACIGTVYKCGTCGYRDDI